MLISAIHNQGAKRRKLLTTIGYEGAKLDDFIQTLVLAKVEVLIDIRERAQSRRKGFSKSALETALGAVGIGYLHLRELGDPKPGREAARAGDMVRFRQIYSAVLRTQEAKAALEAIVEVAQGSNACLLCFERDFQDCHRKLVSDKIESRTGRKTRHLGVKRFEQAASLTR